MYLESNKGHITHNLYGGLPLQGDLIDCIVNPMGFLITDSDISNVFKRVVGPSSVRHSYSSEGGQFSSIITLLCALAFFIYFVILFDY
jgi:hypothetical protein